MSEKREITASDLIATLNADPEFQRRQAEKERRREERQKALDRMLAPCIEELRYRGFVGESIRDIVEAYAPLPEVAVTALLSSLPTLSEPRAAEEVVRALAASAEPFDGRPLAQCFGATSDEALKWAIVNTVALTHPNSIDAWLSEICKSPYWDSEFRKLSRGRKKR